MAFKVGDKVTINDKTYRGHIPRSVTTVDIVGSRFVVTADGQQWHPLRGTKLGKNGKESKDSRIFAYQNGDDLEIQRLKWMANAAPLFSVTFNLADHHKLISDQDLETLAAIGERLRLAQKRAETDHDEDS